jgi:photosystem II stability/assembly factor-like uncharacterized protein
MSYDFIQRATLQVWRSICSDSTGTNLAACAENGSYIHTSTDSGVNWSTNSNSSGSRDWRSICSDSTGTKLAACVNPGYIYTSTNSGLSWSTNSNSSGTGNWHSICSNSDGTKLAACADGNIIYTSTNSGVNWTQQTSSGSRNWRSICSDSTGTKLAACVNPGYIYTSTNSGLSWSTNSNSSGTGSWLSICSDSTGTNLAACADSKNIYTSTDSGVNWTQQTSSGSRIWRSICSDSTGTKLAACVFGNYIYTSTNSGLNWSENFSTPGTKNWRSICSNSTGTQLAAGVNPGYIYTSKTYYNEPMYYTINNIAQNIYTGMISGYIGSSTIDPPGWIIADGAARTYNIIYDNLINLGIGSRNGANYNPPNLNAAFLRGVGSQTQFGFNYTGPSINNFLNSSFRSHNHTASQTAHTHDVKALDNNVEYDITGGQGTGANPTYGLFSADGNYTKANFDSGTNELKLDELFPLIINNETPTNPTITVSNNVENASETRPYNIGTSWIIKL